MENIGESQITPQIQQQAAPDIVNPQGQQQLVGKLASTMVKKQFLDYIFNAIADKFGGEFNSRIKHPETIVQKVVKKRADDKNYGLDDINDMYGGRIVVNKPSDISKVKNLVENGEKLGIFKIGKNEMVKNGAHQAYHFDITTPDGINGEIQIMTPHNELKSVAEHPLYATMGDKLPPMAKALVNTQDNVINKMGKNEAHQKAMQIQEVGKQINGKPIDPRIIAQILSQK